MAPTHGPQIWPHPAYRIETGRLVLRCYHPEDAAELARSIEASRDHLAPWMPWAVAAPQRVDECVELIRSFRSRFDLGSDFTYGVYDPDSAEQIGGAGLHGRVGPDAFEIGYWIAGHRVREGLATEAAGALTKVAFEVLGARRLEIRCDPANLASAGVPRKLGYHLDGTLRWSYMPDGGEPRDSLVHTMTGADYPTSPAARIELRALDAIGRPLLPKRGRTASG